MSQKWLIYSCFVSRFWDTLCDKWDNGREKWDEPQLDDGRTLL